MKRVMDVDAGGVNDICSVAVVDGLDLVDLFDELAKEVDTESKDDRRDFRHNRSMIAAAFRRGTLRFFVDVRRLTDVRSPPLHAPWRFGRIPAFAITPDESGGCSVIWVRQDWRRRGYGRAIAELLEIRHVEADPETLAFWTAIGFAPKREVRDRDARVVYTVMEKHAS